MSLFQPLLLSYVLSAFFSAYLIRKMGVKTKPKIVDITRKIGTVDTLCEARINCTKEEKVCHWTQYRTDVYMNLDEENATSACC